MINKIRISLFFLTLIAFLLSAVNGFSATQTLLSEDNGKVLVLKSKKDKDDDDDDDDDDKGKKDKDDDDDDDDDDDKGK